MFNLSEGQSLFLVVCLLYLSDCFIWLGRDSVVYVGSFLGKWAPKFASSYIGTDAGGIARLNLIPPAGRTFFAHLLPFSISPTAVVSRNPQTIRVSKSIIDPIQEYLIDQIQDIQRNEREVLINGRLFCKFSSVIQAENAVLLIKGLKVASIEKRENLIKDFWMKQFDLNNAQKAHSQLARRTRWLKRFSIMLFALLLAAPLLSIRLGLNLTILTVAFLMYLLAIVIACIFYRCHSELFIDQKVDRILETIKMIICPPIAVRAADQLSINLFVGYDFLLIAYLMLSPGKFIGFAAEAFRCLKYPEIDKSLNELSRETIDWQNKILLALTDRFLSGISCDSRQFLIPPSPQDAGSMSYCPRCLNQSYNSDVQCVDCIGVMTFSLLK